MANENPSRSPTLADVLDAVALAEVVDKRRAELSSAIRIVGRALNRPLDQIPAESAPLRRRLEDVSPIAIGMSPGRWANIRSLLRAALALVKPNIPVARRKPMSTAWVALFVQLSKAGRIRSSRFFGFLSELAVEPNAVTHDHFEQFRQMLHSDALIRKPDLKWRHAAGVWNSARQQIPGWPDVEVRLVPRRNTYTLPWSAFPSSLKADVDGYLARISGSDLLDDLPCRPVRPSTRETRQRQLRGAASALALRGRDPAGIGLLASLVEIDNFKEILRFALERHGNQTSTAVENLARFLKSVARHWVRVDTAVLDQMSTIIKRVAAPATGMTTKNRERLRVFQDDDNLYALLDLPQRLMREATSGRYPKLRSAILAQVAVGIELLLVRPIRISNLRGLDLHQHLIVTRTGSWHVAISEDEVKNEVHLEHEVPPESAKLLKRYLSEFRPLLAKPGNAALFPGRNGIGRKSKNTLGGQIVGQIKRCTGLQMNCHLFRHLGGFVHLRTHPGEYAVVADVLGHKSLGTTRKYYAGMEAAAAVRHFDKTIMDLRNRIRPSKGTLIRQSRASHRDKPKNGKG